jgi:D-alanyl-lipoteichoic acid acyltransferase DltB (MBOAT superfamily)
MLFNSHIFLFGFLPVTLGGFFMLGRIGALRAGLVWLAMLSVGFYAWWNPWHVPIVIGSIAGNYFVSQKMATYSESRRMWLVAGVVANLTLLGWFKYAGFFTQTLNVLSGLELPTFQVALPLGISFFTFTQIAYLVDHWRGRTASYGGMHYALFVLFFPHLIAGPIVHHHQLVPQLRRREIFRFDSLAFAVGIVLFIIGLGKKMILADGIAKFVRPAFHAAASGETPGFTAAWGAALAYTLQLYFDFSGYSDMALGLARMFNVRFPVNFNSPYQAVSIADFWRRWHITLSSFLRDYLYVPLGGNRGGRARTLRNLFLTMLLGGLWHGAGWTFVAWGAYHGACLVAHHVWTQWPGAKAGNSMTGRVATFLVVVIGWVLFRADSLPAAARMLYSMVNPTIFAMAFPGRGFVWIAVLLAVVWAAPNSQQMLARFDPALDPVAPSTSPCEFLMWRPNLAWAVATATVFVLAVLHLSQISEFIYFQF